MTVALNWPGSQVQARRQNELDATSTAGIASWAWQSCARLLAVLQPPLPPAAADYFDGRLADEVQASTS